MKIARSSEAGYSHVATPPGFNYRDAFSRNIGWFTEWEQQALRSKTIAIAGMGGVGGVHLLTLARQGIGGFKIADLDTFETANFNRQVGAGLTTLGRPKVEVMSEMARDINPDLRLAIFADGIRDDNIDGFLADSDLFVDGLDFFAIDIRRKVFSRCAALGIPAITAAPIGMGTAYLVFMPGGMTFEEYFRLEGLPKDLQYVNFGVGLTPKGFHRSYLVDPSRLDLAGQSGPSTAAAVQLCAGVVSAEAVKLLLRRGKVRAAPFYHQFDAYRGKWKRGRLLLGNRGPIQMIRCRFGYRNFARLSRNARPTEMLVTDSDIARILDLARWAPSGDNSQPWRFEILNESSLVVHVRDQAVEDIYDYNGGQPTALSSGMLLESIRIAASGFGRSLRWTYRGSHGHEHVIDVELLRDSGVTEDPLFPFLTIRSVDRRRYRRGRLTSEQKAMLEATLGSGLKINWQETVAERWRMALINALSTDIRLRLREAYEVHRRILDWDNRFSPDGVPVTAVGLDPFALKIMRWAIQSWRRMNFLNRFLGGNLLAQIQLDLLPGLCCAAHFSVSGNGRQNHQRDYQALLCAGQALQRFWLTATSMGLAMQPSLAPLIFAHYARHDPDFLADKSVRRKAVTLAAKLNAAIGGDPDDNLFRGRLGESADRTVRSRSIRQTLEVLSKPWKPPISSQS